MPTNRATLIRIKTIDQCLQRRNRRWTLDDLIEACSDALSELEGRDTNVSRRTIQADIQLMRSDKLGYNAPIVVKDKKYYHYDDPDYSISKIPLSEQDISTLNGAVDILRHFQIFPQLSPAVEVINKLQEHIAVAVNQSVPAIDLERNERYVGMSLLNELYEAVRNQEPLLIYYQSFKAAQPKKMVVSPYLLKEYRNRWFLLGTNGHNTGFLSILPVDRMRSVQHDESLTFVSNPKFDAATFFDDVIGVTKSLGEKSSKVVLHFDADQAPYVLTKPLHRSQKLLKVHKDGSAIVSVQVVLNLELEREILGFAEHVEVLSPRRLRHNICRHHQLSNQIYADGVEG